MKPFSVYYSGGSAGCFFTLTLALASQKTHSISSTNSIQEIINKSWKFDDDSNWDDYSVSYDYQFAKDGAMFERSMTAYDSIIDSKQYYVLMPDGKLPIIKYNNFSQLINDNTISILIYTDVDTQFALMEMKHRRYFDDNGYWLDYKNPGNMFDEDLLEYPSPTESYNDRLSRVKHSLSFSYKQIRVLKRYNELVFNDIDYKFLLQDVIKTKFKCVTDVLELEHNQEVIEHVEHWVSLHPDNIQEMFYKC